MNNKVTIITTPHSDERLPYLKRFLTYYEQSDSPPQIIVADSSPGPIENKIILNQLKNKFVKYIKYSHDTRFESKLVNSLEYTTTPYTVFCSEDDLITYKGLNKACQLMDKQIDVTAVYGYLINFFNCDNSVIIKRAEKMQKVVNDSRIKRIEFFISNFPSSLFGAVYRTEILKRIWNLTESHTNDLEFGELLPAFLTPIYGKIESIPNLYWVRDYSPDSLGQSVDTYRLINIVEDGSYFYKYNKFRHCMVKEICRNSDLDSIEAEDLVNNSFEKYFLKRIGCSYKQIRRKLFYKKVLKKTGVFSFAKRLKSKIKPNPVIVSQEQNYEDDPLFPKDEWDEMKMFLENNMISQ